MVIKASAAREIRTLIAALTAGDEVRREVAAARLVVIGGRAVDRLLAIYQETHDSERRVAILRVLEAIGDARALSVARSGLTQGGDVAIAAAGVLRVLLESGQSLTATEALDGLMGMAVNPAVDRHLRLAAFDALQSVSPAVRTRVAGLLQQDAGLGPHVPSSTGEAAADALWIDAVEGRFPDDPRALREIVEARAGAAPFITLQKLVDSVRAREQSAGHEKHRKGWQGVRGSLHHALALRNSRVALYDLRESVETATRRLPPSFLTALHAIGDKTCLEPLAVAYSRADRADRTQETWRQELAAAFRDIARREKLTRRHAVLKRIAARWPAARELAARAGG